MMRVVAAWIACVVVGAVGGFLLGWILWEAGFELLGSSVAIIGAGFGGLFVLIAYLKRTEAI